MAQVSVKKKKKLYGGIQRSKGEKIFSVFNTLFMLLMLIIFLYPLLNMLSISLSKDYAVLAGKVTFYPVGFNTSTYEMIFENKDLWRSIGNSAFVSGIGCVLSLIALSVAAYPLAFGDFYGKKLYNALIMFTMWFNAGIVPLFLTISKIGLYDSLWALIVNGLISAYNVVIIRSYFQSIPMSIIESARIDGANDFRILFQMVIPLAKPVMATVALWIIVGHWNDYLNSLMFLSTRSNYTLQLVLKELVLNAEASIHNISAAGSASSVAGSAAIGQQMKNGVLVVAMIPMIIIYPFAQKYFVAGVTVGSVKE